PAAVQSYLTQLGINAVDAASLSGVWLGWQAQGSTGLNNLKTWMNGAPSGGLGAPTGTYNPSLPTAAVVPGVVLWNGAAVGVNQPKTYYAVCRLFNRAYPGGQAWTTTSFSADWRHRFFGTTDNTVLFTNNGVLKAPGSAGMCSAITTYNAILPWLKSTP